MKTRKNLLSLVDLYNERKITKAVLFLLLPKKDAEAVIIGSKTGRESLMISKKAKFK